MQVNIPDTSFSSLGYRRTRAGEQQVCATGENSTLHHDDVWFTNCQLPLRIRLCFSYLYMIPLPSLSSQVTSTTLRLPLLNLQTSM